MKRNLTCPEEINGLPVVCTWIEGWQKKMGEFIDKRQDFILLGEEEYLNQIEEAYRKKALKDLIRIILLGGAGAAAVPGVTATSLSLALGLGIISAADPEPISKSVLIASVATILGITAAVLIWKIVKLLKDRVVFTKVSYPFGMGFEMHFE